MHCPISHDQRLFGKESCRRSQFPASSHGDKSQLGGYKHEVTTLYFLQVVLLVSLSICEASPLFLDQPYQGYLDDAWFNFWNQFFFALLGINLGESGTDYQGFIFCHAFFKHCHRRNIRSYHFFHYLNFFGFYQKITFVATR